MTFRIPIAVRALRKNHWIRPGDLTSRALAATDVPAAGLVVAESDLVGAYLRADKAAQATFLEAEVAKAPELPGDAHLLSLVLDVSAALGGLLEPGQEVRVFGRAVKPDAGHEQAGELAHGSIVAVLKGSSESALALILSVPEHGAETFSAKLAGASDLRLLRSPPP